MQYGRNIVTAAALFSFFVLMPVNGVQAENTNTTKQKEALQQKTRKQAKQDRKAVIKEAVQAVRFTRDALAALDNDERDKALDKLEKASGKLDIVLARNPELALAPVDVQTTTYDIHGQVEDVHQARDRVEELMDDGKVQKARRIMATLASETVIETTNIPLQTYPDAIRRVVAFIDENNMKKAKRLLQSTLNTLLVTERAIPLPLVATRQMLDKAQELAEKGDRSEKENKRLDELLGAIRKEIKFAQALSYGKEKDFDKFHDKLDKIRAKTEGGDSQTVLFGIIREDLDALFDYSRSAAKNKTDRQAGDNG